MKTALTIRIDPELLAAARQCAERENRSLTNLIETVLKQWIGDRPDFAPPPPHTNKPTATNPQ